MRGIVATAFVLAIVSISTAASAATPRQTLFQSRPANPGASATSAPITPPSVTLMSTTRVPRLPDRSPILRSFDARLRPTDPYALQPTLNRRTSLKW